MLLENYTEGKSHAPASSRTGRGSGFQPRLPRPPRSDPGRPRIEIHPSDYARIEVEDEGGPWTEATPDPSRGHGLDIIRALASDSGIDGDCTSRAVWARLDWPECG